MAYVWNTKVPQCLRTPKDETLKNQKLEEFSGISQTEITLEMQKNFVAGEWTKCFTAEECKMIIKMRADNTNKIAEQNNNE